MLSWNGWILHGPDSKHFMFCLVSLDNNWATSCVGLIDNNVTGPAYATDPKEMSHATVAC